MILNPKQSDELDIDCFVDSDFAGLWGSEDPEDPTSVRSRTGFIIYVAGCPVIWSSKLQSEISSSTMHAEYVALSFAMHKLLPFQRLVQEVAEMTGIKMGKSKIRCTVWEDNSGAMTLANMEPGRITPRSKHYGIKVHWFRSKLGQPEDGNIQVKKIASANNLSNIMTKGLGKLVFLRLRKAMMGF